MVKSFLASRFAATASVCILAACAGGGGGGPATTAGSGPTNGTGTPSGPSSGSGTSSDPASGSSGTSGGTGSISIPATTFGSGSTDTNSFAIFSTGSTIIPKAGTVPVVTAPTAATTGTNSTPAPSGALPINGAAFPLRQSAISITANGIAPDAAANAGGATLSVLNWNPSGESQFQLTIPGLGVDATFTSASLLKGPSTVNGGTFRLTSSNANYAALGLWEVETTSTVAGVTEGNIHLGAFATGYETPASALPTSGTATYSGTHNVIGLVTSFPPSGGIARASLRGDASLSANFASGVITGSFTNVTAGGSLPWNDVSVSASLTAGTSHFSGSTAAMSAPTGAFALSGTATGRIDGGFYGLAANELGAVWSLKDSTGAAMGVVVGAPAP